MLYLGIDVGFTGGLVALEGENIYFQPPSAYVAKAGPGGRNEYIPATMAMALQAFRQTAGSGIFAVLERVHAMPGQGVSSMFAFGRGLGLWEGLLAGLEIPYQLMLPQQWQKIVLGSSRPPEARRLAAIALYPKCVELLARKKDSGLADALLMATAGRIVHEKGGSS